jgi:hypothetical protein|tara:strand:+ start:128 stop:313 length:186 start_codon:yes stop_codon:yes gene_type:complete
VDLVVEVVGILGLEEQQQRDKVMLVEQDWRHRINMAVEEAVEPDQREDQTLEQMAGLVVMG